jgi:two-component system KDP operon response regulator KdpE
VLLDLDRRLVHLGDQPVHLTPKEFDLFALLASNAGRVVTHRQALTQIWGPAHHDDVQYLRVVIAQLRAKLEADPGQPRLILNEAGVGYRLVSP